LEILDYSRSFLTFFTTSRQGSNIARIQIDARCRVDGWGTDGGAGTFHLIAPCRSEMMYRDGQLFQMPNYEFCGIFSDDEVVIHRTQWTSENELPEHARIEDRFDRIAIDTRHLPAEPLATVDAIVAATLENRLLVARTTIRDEATNVNAVLEYPIKTMNVTTDPAQFQVDTGPIIVPLLEASGEPAITRFAIAHIVYCTHDRAEFILRMPHVVGERDGQPVRVTDYSEIRFTSASHELWGESA
jgi:hypothetical protein